MDAQPRALPTTHETLVAASVPTVRTDSVADDATSGPLGNE